MKMELPKLSYYNNILKDLFCIRRGNSIFDITCLPLWSMVDLKGIGSKGDTSGRHLHSTLLITVRLMFTSLMMQSKSFYLIMVASKRETNYHMKTSKPIYKGSTAKNAISSKRYIHR